MVNFAHEPHWVRDAQRAGTTLFLVIPMSLSSEEMSIWIKRLSKECPHQCREASSNRLRSWIEQGRGRVNSFSLLEMPQHLLLPLDSVFLVFRCWDSDWDIWVSISDSDGPPNSQDFRLRLNDTTGFPGSPSDRRSQAFLASTIFWANSCNSSPLI